MIALSDLLTATDGTVIETATAQTFSGFAFDSRLVQPGELFVAVKTERGDGHRYIAEAVAKGAAGVLCQSVTDAISVTTVLVENTQMALQAWGRYILQKYGTEVIGVTGSTGKTTTKEVIAHLLTGLYPIFKNPGNWNGRYGLPLALGQLQSNHSLAVLEMASDARGEIADLAALAPPTVGVVTTVQATHLEVFGDLETIAREKGALVRALPPQGVAFLNADDPRVAEMAHRTTARVVYYGMSEPADLRTQHITVGLDGTRFTLTGKGIQSTAIFVPLLGHHLMYPVLAAIGVALHYRVPLGTIVTRLATLSRVPGRLNPLTGIHGTVVLDDTYNASPAAVVAALDTLAKLPAHRRVAVLGDMSELGDYSEAGHAEVGRKAAEVVDFLVTKGERARLIAQVAEKAGLPTEQIAVTYTEEDAVRAATGHIGAGDVVLVKGGNSARMERVSAQLLANPDDRRYLVRQDEAWQQILSLQLDRPTWLEIDLNAIAQNTRHLKQFVGDGVQVMAVMKADAYGHGAVKVAQTALLNGATWLGVAALPEVMALHAARVDAPTLLLGYTPPWQARAALRYGTRITLFSWDVAQAVSKAAVALQTIARVHIKVDTGMHRLGLPPAEVVAFVKAVRELPHIEVEGIFTHFSVADSIDDFARQYTREQIRQFKGVLATLEAEGITIPMVHAANSAGTLRWREAHFNMVRPGIALYGLTPSPDVPIPDFRPALSWKTQIAQVQTYDAGAFISYGATYETKGVERIATIPVGYADGFRRAPHTWGEVLVRGQRAPIVGRVCMDQTMINVTHISDVQAGDEVVLIGKQGNDTLSAEAIAARLGTISYEVVAAILARVPRVG
jgi:Alr-MurF fusion protein